MHGWRQTGPFLCLTGFIYLFIFVLKRDNSHICPDKGVFLSWKEADEMDRPRTMVPLNHCRSVCFVYNTTAPQDKASRAAQSDECDCWT